MNRPAIRAARILPAVLAAALFHSGALCTPRHLDPLTDFNRQVIAEIAPRQPYDAFFGECPSLVHGGGTTFFVYANRYYDVYARTFDHATGRISGSVFVADGWNDHVRPAIIVDGDGFLHVLYAARPNPLRHHRSIQPMDHSGWSGHEQVGASATYPVPFVLGDRLLVMYREGDSYSASLSLAVRDLRVPMGSSGAWTVTMLVEESSVFVPMPLAAFDGGGSACFLFNMRDALLSSPYTSVAPSIREGMSVVCTADGVTFTDLDGVHLETPLGYTGNRRAFPEVTVHDEYVRHTLDEGSEGCDTGDLRYDGSFVELTVTPRSYGRTAILVGGGTGCSCSVEFTGAGLIVMSDDDSPTAVRPYELGTTYAVRLKFHFTAGRYRPWINGALAGDPLRLASHEAPPGEELSVRSITVTARSDCSIEVLSGREYKLITASACRDAAGVTNLFFIDRMDSSVRSRWRLMHQHGDEIEEIGDPLYHKYHPSTVRIGDRVYVAAAFFEGEGLFLRNEHLCMNSRIVLLASGDLENWVESEVAAGSGGHVHPVFKRDDGSGVVELVWARMESETSTSLMHGFTGSPDTLIPALEGGPAVSCIPNPFSSRPTIRLVLDRDRSVGVEIYDCAGRCVRRLLERRPMPEGEYDIPWHGDGDNGAKVAPGVYFVRARFDDVDRSLKILLIR